MTTAFKYLDRDSTSPMMRFKDVIPSDANDLPTSSGITFPVRGLHNKGSGGTAAVVNREGDSEIFYIPQGGNLPVYCVRVLATGTTISLGDLIAFG